jgi:hypothetical protein
MVARSEQETVEADTKPSGNEASRSTMADSVFSETIT